MPFAWIWNGLVLAPGCFLGTLFGAHPCIYPVLYLFQSHAVFGTPVDADDRQVWTLFVVQAPGAKSSAEIAPWKQVATWQAANSHRVTAGIYGVFHSVPEGHTMSFTEFAIVLALNSMKCTCQCPWGASTVFLFAQTPDIIPYSI